MQQDTGLNAFIGRGCVDGVYSFDRSPGRPCRPGVLTDTNGLRKLVLACQLVRSDSNPCMAMAPFYLPPETVPVTVATRRLHSLRIGPWSVSDLYEAADAADATACSRVRQLERY
jgi:hypothetical protein